MKPSERPPVADPISNLRRNRRFRFVIGIGLLLAMVPPAIVESNRAIKSMDNSPSDWIPDNAPAKEDWNQFERFFSETDVIFVSWPGCEIENESVDDVAEALAEMDSDNATAGKPWFAKIVNGKSVLVELTSPQIGLSESQAISRLERVLIGKDRKTTCILLFFTRAGYDRRFELIDQFRARIAEIAAVDPQSVYFAGPPITGMLTDKATIATMQKLTFPAWLVAAVIAIFCLRSLVLAMPILIIALIGEGFTLALVLWFGAPMNAILIVLPPLVFVLTVSSGIHLSNYFLEVLEANPGIHEELAAAKAIAIGAGPCWLAAITTVIGLGSLTLVPIWPVAYFGLVAAIGVLLMLSVLLLIHPTVMVVDAQLRRRGVRIASRPLSAVAARRYRGVAALSGLMEHPLVIVALFLVVTAIAASGIPHLRTSVNMLRMFSPQSELRRSSEWLEEHLGPLMGAELLVVIPDGVLMTEDEGEPKPDALARLTYVRRMHGRLYKAFPDYGIVSAHTFLPLVKRGRMWQAVAARSAIRGQVEDSDSRLYKSGYLANRPGQQAWRISLGIPSGTSVSTADELAKVRLALDDLIADAPQGVSMACTGRIPLNASAQAMLLKGLFHSFVATFAVVAVVMMLLLRSVVGGLLSMFPNLFPTLTLFGLMGWLRQPLDIGTVMTASVALGIAVDGTVHMLRQYQFYERKLQSRKSAAIESLSACGPAMWQTTLICGLSLSVFAYTDFVPTQRFSIMMFGLLVAALVGDAIILTAMMVSPLGNWFTRKSKDSKSSRVGRQKLGM